MRRSLGRLATCLLAGASLVIALVPASTGAEGPSKVPAELSAQLGGGSGRFLVGFRPVDLSSATAGRRGSDRVRAVVSLLQANAAKQQAAALRLLDADKLAGDVSSYQSFWIGYVAVTGDLKAANDLAALPEVDQLYPDLRYHIDLGPRPAGPSTPDGCGGPQWNLQVTRATAAWDDGYSGQGVTLGVIDTGADWQHEALVDNYGWDGVTHQYSWDDEVQHQPVPYDDNDHGTHVTGSAAGRCGIGVAKDAHWIHCKGLGADGSGSVLWLLACMQWMLAPGGDPGHAPRIVSNSWGGSAYNPFRTAIQAWVAANILPVFANGNSGPNPGSVIYPAAYPEAYGVGNLDYGYYSGPAVTALPAGPGPLVSVYGTGPPPQAVTAPYHFVGLACSPIGDDLTGKVALVERGTCTFAVKDVNVQNAHALAMLLYNNVPVESPPAMAAIPATGVPGLAIKQAEGQALVQYEIDEPNAQINIDPSTILDSIPFDVPIIASTSSRGPSPFDGGLKPQVTAPGTNVRSAKPGGGYQLLSGTSMATPHVAGAAAVMISRNSNLTVAQIESILESTAVPLGDPVPNNDYGYGAIDVLAAEQAS